MKQRYARILFINTSTQISGAEKSLIDLINKLSAQVSVLVSPGVQNEIFEKINDDVSLEQLDLIRFTKKRIVKQFFSTITKTIVHTCKLREIVKRHEINLIYANGTSALIYAILLKIILGKRIIWHVRDNLSNGLFSIIASFLSNKIICVSQHIYKQVLIRKKACVVYNGIDPQQWKSKSAFLNYVKDELGIRRDTILIGHIGQLVPWKRHDLFLEIAHAIINCKEDNAYFIIIGTDLFNAFPEYVRLLKQKIGGQENRIFFLDYRADIMSCIQGLDILVHLAKDEPFGRVLIEAMALEKPVIALNEGGPCEIVNNNYSGYLVNKAEAVTIVHKLKTLLHNPDLRKRFGIKGRMIVENRFTLENLGQIDHIISSVIRF